MSIKEKELSEAAKKANREYAEALISKGYKLAQKGYDLHRENWKNGNS